MIIRHAQPRQVALGQLSGAGARSLFDGLEEYANAEMRGFGAFDPATSALGVITKVKLAYTAGGGLIQVVPLDFNDLLLTGNPFFQIHKLIDPDAFASPSKNALAKSYKDLGAQIDDWADRKYRWAKTGRRDDGTPYSWKQWGELGEVYLNSITYLSALPVSNGLFANAAQSVKEFIQSIANLFTPSEWPTWAKVAAGLAGLVAVAYIVNTVRGPLR